MPRRYGDATPWMDRTHIDHMPGSSHTTRAARCTSRGQEPHHDQDGSQTLVTFFYDHETTRAFKSIGYDMTRYGAASVTMNRRLDDSS